LVFFVVGLGFFVLVFLCRFFFF